LPLLLLLQLYLLLLLFLLLFLFLLLLFMLLLLLLLLHQLSNYWQSLSSVDGVLREALMPAVVPLILRQMGTW
jgi:hypothetical protein